MPDFTKMTPAEFAAWQAEQSSPTSPAPQEPYAVTAWGSQLYDFVVPSGQRCQMRKLRPEELIGTGLLDRITRLPGFAQEQIDRAEGKPPVKEEPVPTHQLAQILPVLNDLVPLVVVQPKVYADPAETGERVEGRVYVSDIELQDRIAIMERATGQVRKMDNFRAEPGESVQRVVNESGHEVSA